MLHKKGFTLIELIIVIALIALLATTVILVINPVKIFQEARDSQRIADLGQMNSAMSIALATSGTVPALGNCTNNAAPKCYQNVAASNCVPRYVVTSPAMVVNTNAIQKVDGTGWVPVSLIANGATAAIAAWPIDPKNNAANFYSYTCDGSNQWEFAAKMESPRYSSTGTDDVEKTDGGNVDTLFEVGTNVGL